MNKQIDTIKHTMHWLLCPAKYRKTQQNHVSCVKVWNTHHQKLDIKTSMAISAACRSKRYQDARRGRVAISIPLLGNGGQSWAEVGRIGQW